MRVAPTTESLAGRRVSTWRLPSRPLSLVGSTIVLKASEFLPTVYNSGTHTALEHIARGIDYACEELGLDFDKHLNWKVPLAEVGDCEVTNEFFRSGTLIVGSLVTFTDVLAGLLVWALDFDKYAAEESIAIDVENSLERLRANENLRGRWEYFFLRFAGLAFKGAPEEPVFNDNQTTTKFQLTSAMEVFVLAREYAHHLLRHDDAALRSLVGSHGDAFRSEFEADEFALKIGSLLGSRGFSGNFSAIRNTWMESGAGAVAVLRGIEIVRRVRETLQTGAHSDENSGSSVPHGERLIAFEKWASLVANPLATQFSRQRSFVGRLLPDIYNQQAIRFPAAYRAGYRPKHAELHKAAIESARAGVADTGLVEILCKGEVVDLSQSKAAISLGVLPSAKNARNPKGIAAHLKLSTAGASASHVREYLDHRKDSSITDLANHLVASRIGVTEPNVSKAIAERLRLNKQNDFRSGFEELTEIYSYWIESTCEKLALPLHGGVACGVVWSPTFEPLQQNFFNSDVSRIEIPEWTFMLCHFFAKLLSRAAEITVEERRLAVLIDAPTVVTKIRSSVKLRKYAAGFLTSFATGDRRAYTPMRKVTGKIKTVYWHLLTASEVFVLAHEYAHHILEHKCGGSASVDDASNELMKAQELAADLVAARIAAHIGVDLKSPHAHLGGGAVLALMAVDILRRAKSVLSTGMEQPFVSDTHPTLKERLLNLALLRYDPRNEKAAENTRNNFERIMEEIWTLVLPDLQQMHARGIRPLSRIPDDLRWLRFSAASELSI
jgi:hypothetical protein